MENKTILHPVAPPVMAPPEAPPVGSPIIAPPVDSPEESPPPVDPPVMAPPESPPVIDPLDDSQAAVKLPRSGLQHSAAVALTKPYGTDDITS